MTAKIDTDLLISAVEEHPQLWDNSSDFYKCRNATANAWNSVCQRVNPEFDAWDARERSGYVQLVMKRWKNTRDTWLKAQKKMLDEEKYGTLAKTTFIYQEQMRFLQRVLFPGTAEPSIKLEQDTEDTEIDSASSYSVDDERMAIPVKKPRLDQPSVNELRADAVEMNIVDNGTLETTDDRHMSFFRGIRPSLNQLDEDQILEFQAGVVTLLQNVRRRKSQSSRAF